MISRTLLVKMMMMMMIISIIGNGRRRRRKYAAFVGTLDINGINAKRFWCAYYYYLIGFINL